MISDSFAGITISLCAFFPDLFGLFFGSVVFYFYSGGRRINLERVLTRKLYTKWDWLVPVGWCSPPSSCWASLRPTAPGHGSASEKPMMHVSRQVTTVAAAVTTATHTCAHTCTHTRTHTHTGHYCIPQHQAETPTMHVNHQVATSAAAVTNATHTCAHVHMHTHTLGITASQSTRLKHQQCMTTARLLLLLLLLLMLHTLGISVSQHQAETLLASLVLQMHTGQACPTAPAHTLCLFLWSEQLF